MRDSTAQRIEAKMQNTAGDLARALDLVPFAMASDRYGEVLRLFIGDGMQLRLTTIPLGRVDGWKAEIVVTPSGALRGLAHDTDPAEAVRRAIAAYRSAANCRDPELEAAIGATRVVHDVAPGPDR